MDDRLERLETHCIGLCTELVWPRITAEGCIWVRAGNGSVYGDSVTTHHFVDLLHTLGSEIFSRSIGRACEWFLKDRANLSDPFFVTTLAQSGVLNAEGESQVTAEILKHRRNSGLIEIFAGFLDGGSLFSTLWAVKILLLLQGREKHDDLIAEALGAVRQRWTDLHRSSFKGFYLELLLEWKGQDRLSEVEEVCVELLAEQGADALWDKSPLYSAYVGGNLLKCVEAGVSAQAALASTDRYLSVLFSLDREAKGVPEALAPAAVLEAQSVDLQQILRSLVTACRRLRMEGRPVGQAIVAELLGRWPLLYQATASLEGRLQHMQGQYGAIEQEFQKQLEAARPLMEQGPYERNVFVMMPFRKEEDEQYERIERIIREELEKKGMTAWLASDRDLDRTVWGNITSFMTACKYGVAVFTRRDNVRSGTIEQEFNPNVSLELGFMVSRAKRVLLLKDSLLPTLPTDLMGHLYKEFSFRNASTQLPPILSAWADEVLAAEAAPGSEQSEPPP